MRRGGIRGIRDILNTGIILSDSILNGADTRLVTSMTKIFITGTTAARGEVGIKDGRGIVPREPPVPAIVAREPPVLDIIPKEQPLLDIIPKRQPVPDSIPKEQRLLDIILPELPVLAFMARQQPVLQF